MTRRQALRPQGDARHSTALHRGAKRCASLLRRACWCVAARRSPASHAPAAAQQPVMLRLSHFLGPDQLLRAGLRATLGEGAGSQDRRQGEGGDLQRQLGVRRGDQTGDTGEGRHDRYRARPARRRGRSFPAQLDHRAAVRRARTRSTGRVRCGGSTRTARSAMSTSDYKVLALFVHNPGLIHTATSASSRRRPEGPAAARAEQDGRDGIAGARRDAGGPAGERRHAGGEGHSIDGIVTNWGNPLPGFNDYMKFHTDIAFYTSAFFVVMNTEVRRACRPMSARRSTSCRTSRWSRASACCGTSGIGRCAKVRQAPAMRSLCRTRRCSRNGATALRPAADRYLDMLVAGGFTDARSAYEHVLISAQRR